MRRLHLLPLTFLTLVSIAAPARAQVAPGRVVLDLDSPSARIGVDPRGLDDGVSLDDGGAVLVGSKAGAIRAVKVTRDGRPDPAFGSAGVARITLPGTFPQVLDVLQRPDGRLLVVVTGASVSRFETPRLTVVALLPDGRPDPTFGTGGVVQSPIDTGCGNCAPAALQPDGRLVLTGETGGTAEPTPTVARDTAWTVTRLEPDGSVDTSFGDHGIATVGRPDAAGTGIAVLESGTLATVGHVGRTAQVVRLDASGAPLAGSTPYTLPEGPSWWHHLLPRPTDAVDVLGSGTNAGRVLRLTAANVPDPGYGTDGSVAVPGGIGADVLLPGPGRGEIVAGPDSFGDQPTPARLQVTRLDFAGRVLASGKVGATFGGGYASVAAVHRAVQVMPLGQSGLRIGQPVARPDGSLFVPGAVGVLQYTGEGEGFGVDRATLFGVTRDDVLDPGVGAPATPARLTVGVPAQRARTAADERRYFIAITANASGPGLCTLEVRSGRHLLAHSTAPVLAPGRQRLRALLTVTARRSLKRAGRRTPVTVTARFRDLVGQRASSTARGTLR